MKNEESTTEKSPDIRLLNSDDCQGLLYDVHRDRKIQEVTRLNPLIVAKDVSFETIESFAAYVNQHKTPTTTLFCCRLDQTLNCIFDYHKGETPGRCRAKANLQLQRSDELKAWQGKTHFDHRGLVDAITDFDDYLIDESKAILDALRKLEVRSASSLDSEFDPETGDVRVNWNTEKTSGGVTLPREIRLGLPIFRHHDAHVYEFVIKLRIKHEEEGFKFVTTMKDPSVNIRREFERIEEYLATETSLTVFRGNY